MILRPAFCRFPGLVAGMSTRVPPGSEAVPRPVAAENTVGQDPFEGTMNLSYKVGDVPLRVTRNREAFFGELGIPIASLAIPDQVHSSTIVRVEAPGQFPACDGLVCDIAGVFLCVSVADCVPILLVDPARRAVGALHAGWRGTAAGIAELGVERMSTEFGSAPRDLHAFVGPSASVCCYVVGEEVAASFDGAFLRRDEGVTYLNMKEANRVSLCHAGLLPANIEIHPGCTIMGPEYHSYRRERRFSGRMMAVVGFLPA